MLTSLAARAVRGRGQLAVFTALVLLAGIAAAAAQPDAPRQVVASTGGGVRAISRDRGTVGTAAPTSTSPAPSTTTAAPASPRSSTTTAPRSPNGSREPATTTSVPYQPRWTFPGGTWDPGEPYPAEWAATDARYGFPPYPYVVPEVCRAGPEVWDEIVAPSRTVTVAGGGTITVTLTRCVAFREEGIGYALSVDGPVQAQVPDLTDPPQTLSSSPAPVCPSILGGEPIPFGHSWSGDGVTWLGARGTGVQMLTVTVDWVGYGWTSPFPDRPSSMLVCTQIGRGTAQLSIPVVVETWNRPQELGGQRRGPSGLGATG